MFIERNPVPKFILLSLGLHVSIALLISTYYRPEEIERAVRVSVINGSPAAQVLRSIISESPVKSEAVLPKKPTPSENKNVQSLSPTQTMETHQSAGSLEAVESQKEKYKRTLTELINSHKRYPNKALALHQEGVVTLRLVLTKAGIIKSVEVVDESPYKSLATASVETIKAIHKFPPFPKELKMEEYSVRIPIEYKIEL